MPATKRTRTRTRTMLARIHPTAPPRYTVERYNVVHEGKECTFHASRGWYEVSVGLARRLKRIRTNSNDPLSSQVFIVCSRVEAEAMEKAEEEMVAKATAPIKMGVADDPIKTEPEWEDDMGATDEEIQEAHIGTEGDGLPEMIDPAADLDDAELFGSDDELEDEPEPTPRPKKKAKKKGKKKAKRPQPRRRS